MTGRTLILGGGFGGIGAGVELRRLQPEHEVVLVDRKPAFAMGLRKLWEVVGHGTVADGTRERRLLEQHGIEFVEAEVTSIDAAGRSAETSAGSFSADHLVVALGAVSRPDLVPGLATHGLDDWAFAGLAPAARSLADFEGGRIVVLVAGAPYPCPPAPYELALHLDEHLRATDRSNVATRRVRDRRRDVHSARERASASEGMRDGRGAGGSASRRRSRPRRRARRRHSSTARASARWSSAPAPVHAYGATGTRRPSRSSASRAPGPNSPATRTRSSANDWSAGSVVSARRRFVRSRANRCARAGHPADGRSRMPSGATLLHTERVNHVVKTI